MSGKEFLLGLDIGTMGSKGVIINRDGEVVSDFFMEHDINILRPGWVEQDPEKCYWGDFKTIVDVLLKRSRIDPGNIVAVGISSLAPDAAPIDSDGNPIRPCIIYMDRRAQAECQWVKDEIGEEKIHRITGNAVDPYFAGYKILWYMRNEPENYKRTWKILNADKYVIYKLTENPIIDYTNAVIFAPFFDFLKKSWSDEVINKLGFDKDKLPDAYEPSAVVGEITSKAAKETGLAEGTPVIAGAPDAMQSFLSVGGTEPGDSVFMYGTTGCWGLITDKPNLDPRLVNSYYAVPGTYISVAGMIAVGALVRWFRDQFGAYEKQVENMTGVSAYKLLDLQAEKIPPGSDGLVVLPYFMGERTPIWDPKARGIIFGLTLFHTRAHIYRALLEAAGYGLKHHMDIALSMGLKFKRLVAVNGGAKSRLWRQIVTDIVNFPQEYVSKVLGAPYGDAFLAGVGVGLYKDVNEIRNMVKIDEVTHPDPKASEIYSRLYEVYMKLYEDTKEEAWKVSEISMAEGS